MTTQLEICEVR